MKKYIALFSFVAALMVSGCSVYTDEEPGGTQVETLAGTWVTDIYYSYYEDEGTLDLSAAPKSELDTTVWVAYKHTYQRTFNTAANVSTEMWLLDDFWNEQYKVNVNKSSLSFSSDAVPTLGETCEVTVRYGQVIPGAATTPRGQKADSIIAYINYSDDPDYTYKMSGYRYTGYKEDY